MYDHPVPRQSRRQELDCDHPARNDLGWCLYQHQNGPWWVATGRVGIAAIVLTVMGAAMGQGVHLVRGTKAWASIIAFGIISVAIAMGLLTWGQSHVISAFAGIAIGTIPILVLPLAAIFSKDESIGPRRIAGFCIGFIGLCVLVGPGAFDSTGSDLEFWGRLACVGTACLYAVGSIITRRSPPMPQLAFAAGSLWVGTLLLLPTALLFEGLPVFQDQTALMALLYAAIFPTALGAAMRVNIIKSAGSVFMSLTSYMVPVWSVIFGMLILGEVITQSMVLGMMLILGGIGISQSRTLLAMLKR